ncbi:hypothetical protein [Streptomyces regalis]|uniref:hypothetical protein n=1 Tax=Streptomyces regalis TaxID=68262 RepID=UPI001FC9CBA9|nr:hypothetical protein [Streptomyces regalis]
MTDVAPPVVQSAPLSATAVLSPVRLVRSSKVYVRVVRTLSYVSSTLVSRPIASKVCSCDSPTRAPPECVVHSSWMFSVMVSDNRTAPSESRVYVFWWGRPAFPPVRVMV